MDGLSSLLQFILIAVSAVSVYLLIKNRRTAMPPASHTVIKSDSKELMEIRRMRERSLNIPLSEKTRPQELTDIIGQDEGIKALRAAMCGPNPQHVIIYGPPGIGKTCAARLVLEEAKRSMDSPFSATSQFVEVDATCVRFDERAIADPLMGSVHDPIYQGAGALGTQGVPQPKPGAVTRAHCGVLFLDEIGELHPMQMNKLLKVLEDRRVHFDSAYYSKDNASIPPYIHDIFQNGLPADFRLIGATTRMPDELPPAIRSRCMELFFKPLGQKELACIVREAAQRLEYDIEPRAVTTCAKYAASGRDAVNIVQLASGVAYTEKRKTITQKDIEWVSRTCNYTPHYDKQIRHEAKVGVVAGLAVTSSGQGIVMEIECCAIRCAKGCGKLEVVGAVEEEELELRGRRLRRKSTAKGSVENVIAAFYRRFNLDCRDFDIRLNIPGGIPMDGPSAGIAIAVALLSALTQHKPVNCLALTGEISIYGEVLPVGGIREKVAAAADSGAQLILIPSENWADELAIKTAQVVPVSDITEVMRYAFEISKAGKTISETEVLGALMVKS